MKMGIDFAVLYVNECNILLNMSFSHQI